jgi:hypothetical protein
MNKRNLKSNTFPLFTVVILVLLLSSLNRASAQAAGGTLSGIVEDTTGSLIPRAQIIIRDISTGITRTVSTDAEGFYTASNLLPGTYQVTISAPGFKTETRSGVKITVGAQLVVKFSMTVGQVTDSIRVTTETPSVQLASSALSAQVDSTTIRELPLNGRDWGLLATLQPGVVSMAAEQPTIGGTTSSSARGTRGFGNQLTISGGRPTQNNYRLDGISENDYSNSSPGSVLGGATGVDAIAEFSVLTSSYPAEYGRASGGVLNAITRSGTNQFHGDVYEFLRNSALDARNYFDGPQIPGFKRNQFGASAGAPIVRSRTFVFANYEGLRQSLGTTASDNVPSSNARNGIIHNSNGATCTIGIQSPGCAFTNSAGTVGVDPGILPFLALYALPTAGLIGNGDTGIYSFAGQQVAGESFLASRVDTQIAASDSVSGSFQWDRSTETLPDSLDTIAVGQKTGHDFIALEETHIFTAQLLNTVRFGFNRSTAVAGGGLNAINPAAASLALSAVPQWDAPLIQVTGLTNYGGGLNSTSNQQFAWNSFQGYDDAFINMGKHDIRVGFAVERMQDNYTQISKAGGQIKFGSLANFLTNTPTSFAGTEAASVRPRNLRQTSFAGYAQDDFHWRSDLMLNLGLRYEMTTVPTEVSGLLGRLINPSDTTITVGNPYFSNPTLHNFEPRVGFAWDPFGTGKSSVRGGMGLFDVLPLAYEYSNSVANSAPFFVSFSASNLPKGSFPTKVSGLIKQSGNLRVSYIEPHPKRNYVEQWNFSLQREILPSLTATIAYTGSHGVHVVFRADDMNSVTPTLTASGYLYPAPVGSGAVLNPSFGTIDDTDWLQDSKYNALDILIQKTSNHGIQLQGSYTWGKSLDTGSASYVSDPFANSIANLFTFDKSLRRGVSDFNVAQNVSINYSWSVPAPKSFNPTEQWVLGGWELGGVLSARTGLPFTPILGGDPLGVNTEDYDYPDRSKDAGCKSAINPGNVANYINLNCFSVASPILLIGNSGRNTLFGPGLLSLDSSVFKNNYVRRVSDTFNVQFRAELFNALNRANFNSPTDNEALFDQNGIAVPGAGRIDSTSTTAREIQFGVKVIW